MPRTRAPYAAEFLHQMVELVRAGFGIFVGGLVLYHLATCGEELAC